MQTREDGGGSGAGGGGEGIGGGGDGGGAAGLVHSPQVALHFRLVFALAQFFLLLIDWDLFLHFFGRHSSAHDGGLTPHWSQVFRHLCDQ